MTIEQTIKPVDTVAEASPSYAEGGLDQAGECPICAKHRDPETGELRFNDEVMAGMQEVEDMISGKIPVKWHTSLDDLDKMLGL